MFYTDCKTKILFYRKNIIIMASTEQVTSHYMTQCWPNSTMPYGIMRPQRVNTLRPRPNGRHFANAIFKCIFLNENVWIKISLKFVPQGPINTIPVLVQIMAWRRPGDKPLSGPMMVRLPMHIYVTRPQWVNTLWPGKAIMCLTSWSTLFQAMASCLLGTESLHELMVTYC